jgi:succinoglycan biosynthesis transport protein ExoP
MNSLAERELASLGEPQEHDEQTLDLVRYWRAINRNKWRILAFVVAIGVLAVLFAQSLAPVFRGTATLLIEAGKPKIVSIEEVYAAGSANREYFETQVGILKSREMARRLIQRMDLATHPALDPSRRVQPAWQRWLPAGFIPDAPAPGQEWTAASKEAVAVRRVQSALTVQHTRNSQLVRITFDSQDRDLAAAVPNALADLYIESDLEARMKMTQRAVTFINSQVGDLGKKLKESEQALQAFRERERIIDTKGLAQSGATRQLEDLSRSLFDARARRAEAENAYNQVNSALKGGATTVALENLPAVQRHTAVQRFKEAELEAEKRLNEASKRYGPEHPRLVAAESELRSARDNLRRQLGAVTQTVSKEYETARVNEQALERQVGAARSEIQNLNRKEFQLAALERDVSNNRQLYELFIQRFKETNITGEMQSANARVIDPALLPDTAFGPNRRLIVGMALLAALVIAVALALLGERLDNTVKTSNEVESRLGVPALGVVQLTKVKSGQQIERIFLEDPQTSFSEAIRTVRSAVMLSALDSPKKVVVVTSSVPEEGKTTIASNLALALGQVKRTLLVDADMRRPKIGRIMGGPQAVMLGLSELCAGTAQPEQCVFPILNTNVHILPSGRVPPNPQELLASHRFERIVELLGEKFDIIVIDSPPVQMVSDALVLSRLATEVVYVVKADETPYPLARAGVRKLRRASAPLVGVVLNQLDVIKADRYYGEYSGYGRRYYSKKYGYGYGPKK